MSQEASWRWVFLVNPPICLLVLAATFSLIRGQGHRTRLADFDVLGAVLSTGAMLLLVYALVKASTIGWIESSQMLSASMTRTGSPSTKRAARPRASAMPPGRSW